MIEMGFYRFADAAEWEETCALSGVDPEAPPARMAIDVVGEIVRDGLALAGWHVNIAWNEVDPLPAFSPFRVEPSNPSRVFAGLAEPTP